MDNGEFEATFFTTVLVVDCPLERHLIVRERQKMCAHQRQIEILLLNNFVVKVSSKQSSFFY